MRIRIFGAAQFHESFVHVRTALEQRGHTIVVPRKEEKDAHSADEKRKQVERLREELEGVDALLVLNYDHNGVKDALSLAALTTIGVAVYLNKAVYLAANFPSEHAEQLRAYDVQALKSNFSSL